MKIMGLVLGILYLATVQAKAAEPAVAWQPYSIEKVKEATAAGKPVLVDFWAEWCPECHVLDKKVFSDPEVAAQLSRFTLLRVDVTDMNDEKVQSTIEYYNVVGVPTVVFLDGKGKEVPRARMEGAGSAKAFMKSLGLV